MLETVERQVHPELRELVVEASRALARLDADRLEELALSCQALNRDLALGDAQKQAILARQAKAAEGDLRVFSRVLEATRANLNVMKRVREMRGSRLEYGDGPARQWAGAGNGHGNN